MLNAEVHKPTSPTPDKRIVLEIETRMICNNNSNAALGRRNRPLSRPASRSRRGEQVHAEGARALDSVGPSRELCGPRPCRRLRAPPELLEDLRAERLGEN